MILRRTLKASKPLSLSTPSYYRFNHHSTLQTSPYVDAKPDRDAGRRLLYPKTVSNLNIGSQTRVIFQGFTGRQATFDAKQSLEYGTKIVGGVKPGHTGEHLGLPVLPTMRAAMEQLRPDATAVYVAAGQAAGAIEEAIEAEIPLVVAVAEHIPLHDMLRVHAILRTQSKTRLVGPNAPGMISPIGKCRIGFPPIPFFSPGSVGIVAKSGTLSYEAVASTTRAGLGQSLVIGMGGDVLPGTDFVDALTVFEHDDSTKGIIIIGEVGGFAEERVANWINHYRARTEHPKPILALVAGMEAVPGRIMGHAGAFVRPFSTGGVKKKINDLANAGVIITDHPAKLGTAMKELLESSTQASSGIIDTPKYSAESTRSLRNGNVLRLAESRPFHSSASKGRSIHTQTQRPRPTLNPQLQSISMRSISMKEPASLAVLSIYGIPITQGRIPATNGIQVIIDVDRTNLKVWIRTTVRTSLDRSGRCAAAHFEVTDSPEALSHRLQHQLDSEHKENYFGVVRALVRCYLETEASTMDVTIQINPDGNNVFVSKARIIFDDAAYRSAGRQKDIHALRRVEDEVPEEVEAEKDGIVYIKLKGKGHIGTLVNGAGLAMNTVDSLTTRGGHVANFLDTGGKATRDTVKASFRTILHDHRVRTIFVNIFGGLTQCDMIAEGILLAYRDLGITLPVVVRLRGTNEKVGQKMIADSGLPLHVYDDFEEAAAKVIELARSPRRQRGVTEDRTHV